MGRLKNKKILVTGGTGYLGSRLVKALELEGTDVFVLDLNVKNKKQYYSVDITDAAEITKVISKIKPQIIFHLAASLDRSRDFAGSKAVKINYEGTLNLLISLKDILYENFIFTSTSEVYGNNKAPFNETQIPDPVSPYSLSKVFAEHTLKTISALHQKNFTILRVFNFFGEAMPPNFFIPQLIESLRKGESFKMTKGEQVRDFLLVDDIIQAMILSAKNEKAKNEIFNVCSGKGVTLKDLVIEFNKQMKKENAIEFGALPYRENEVWNMVGSNAKIRKLLGFKPKYALKEAIRKVISFK